MHFKAAAYDEALECYNRAAKVANDAVSVYTNRAACYMKMERFDEVMSDCDFAMRVSGRACSDVRMHAFSTRGLLAFTVSLFLLMSGNRPRLCCWLPQCVGGGLAAMACTFTLLRVASCLCSVFFW